MLSSCAQLLRLPARAQALTPGASESGSALRRQQANRRRLPKGSPKRLVGERGASFAAALLADGQTTFADSQEEDIGVLAVHTRHKALVLDHAFQPVAVASWERAITLALCDRALVLESYKGVEIRSSSRTHEVPAVIKMEREGKYVKPNGRLALNRHNILVRDEHRCQYCHSRGGQLTIDHVVPQSKGGLDTWDNLVTCCAACNSKKGAKSLKELGWKLSPPPHEPSAHERKFMLAKLGVAHREDSQHEVPHSVPQEWREWLASNIVSFRSRKPQQAQQAQAPMLAQAAPAPPSKKQRRGHAPHRA